MNRVNNVLYEFFDAEGKLFRSFRVQNTDVRQGRGNCAARLIDVASSFYIESNKPLNYIVLTNDATAIGDNDTGFGIVTFKIASASSKILVTTTTTDDTARIVATVPNLGAPYTVNKAGLFYTDTNPQLFGLACAQVVAPAEVIPTGGALSVTWDVQIT